MPARKRSASAPVPAPAGDDFDAILADAESVIAKNSADLPVTEVRADQVEIVQPERSTRSRSRSTAKETAPVTTAPKAKAPASKAPAPTAPGTQLAPVSEPKRPETQEFVNIAGYKVPLTVTFSDKTLSELERIVAKGLEGFYQVGLALSEINARQLYKEAGHKTFADYLRVKWNMGKSRGYQAIAATEVVQRLTAAGVPSTQMPKTEAAARELVNVVRTSSAEVLKDVVAKATDGGKKAMTAQSAADAVSEVQGTDKRTTSSASVAQRAAQKEANQGAAKASANSTPAATAPPAPLAPGAAGSLRVVNVPDGRNLLANVVYAFISGAFDRKDTAEGGAVEMVRTVRAFCDSWLAGSANALPTPTGRNDRKVIDRIVALVSEAAPKALPAGQGSAPAPVERKKGEDANTYARRVIANPEGVEPSVIEWAKKIVAIPASKEEADAHKAAEAKRAAAVKAPVKAQAMMDATVKARPQTGTDRRRAAEKAASKRTAA